MIYKLKVPLCLFENNNFPCLLFTLTKIKMNTMPDFDIEHKSSHYIIMDFLVGLGQWVYISVFKNLFIFFVQCQLKFKNFVTYINYEYIIQLVLSDAHPVLYIFCNCMILFGHLKIHTLIWQ